RSEVFQMRSQPVGSLFLNIEGVVPTQKNPPTTLVIPPANLLVIICPSSCKVLDEHLIGEGNGGGPQPIAGPHCLRAWLKELPFKPPSSVSAGIDYTLGTSDPRWFIKADSKLDPGLWVVDEVSLIVIIFVRENIKYCDSSIPPQIRVMGKPSPILSM